MSLKGIPEFDLEEESTIVCESCKVNLPFNFQHFAVINGNRYMLCPSCILEIRNRTIGLATGTLFQGEIAEQLYDDWLDYLANKERYMY